VVTASDGARGVEQARAELPDLVLMDLRMPVMDGLAAAEILGSDPTTSHIPIIALSAEQLDAAGRARSTRLFVRHLEKPVASDVLESVIRRLIGDP
jgi:twitching motility two-component system response regulator PilH